ncbi:N-acetyltransferase [Iodidimonas gelatinilytica]|uniref:N-acetyltransferase n=1 Tax=Iodidimonas gelatinilytica TaxID=1236966 RepID=A0A5A7N066_9PROT|nr:GNAT family protein [Iodidimonas gelatinilytica]GEQ98244.1 N-acetyltransferase [Iodidimonas gelatinilytica]GER00599.1 N-acetyltransferase [Iodidimonas gelatinilytica]
MTTRTPTLEKNARLLLRPVDDCDIDALVAARTGVEANRYTGWENPDTEGWARDVVLEMKTKKPGEQGPSGGWYQYAIVDRPTGKTAGDIGVGFGIPGPQQAEIGYRLLDEFQGRGMAGEAVGIMVDHLFGDHGLHRLVATIAAPNRASSRLVEALGFRREGIFKKSFLCYGEWLDDHYYALLEEEWRNRPGRR